MNRPERPELPLACARARALLNRYGDGELEESLAAPLRGHLLECPECRARFAAERHLRRWIVRPEAPPVPAGFAERVAALAFAGAAPAAPLAPSVRPSPLPSAEPALRLVLWLTAAAAAALLILALALGSLGRPGGEELVAEPLPEVLQQLDQLERELEAVPAWSAR